MRKALIGALVVVTLLACFAVPAGAAGALVSSSERQTIPGLTERTIWGRGQVYVYRLPRNVTHTGDLHVELTYAPATGGCFVYLLGPVHQGSSEWQVCPGTYSQGFLSLVPGREVVDYAVPAVLDQTPTDESVVGDAYYAVVQAASGVSRFRLTGYLPRTVAGSTDTTSEATFTRFAFRTPASAKKTITVAGAPYGGAFDLTPTSQGRAECRLQYPADVESRTVPAATPALAAGFEQYVYPYLWEPVGGQIPVASRLTTRTGTSSTGTATPPRRWPATTGTACRADSPCRPVARGASSHAYPLRAGALARRGAAVCARRPRAPGPPATGLRTVGYKATLLIPQNLRLASATKKVRGGRSVDAQGHARRAESAAADATVQWAPAGTLVTVQRKVGRAWTPVRTTRTGANGAWRVSVRVRRTTSWRAVAQPAPGLAVEYSLVKRTVVTR